MNWQELLANHKVKSHKTSLLELVQLREVVARDLKDGRIRELSTDRRFACLYSAALQLSHMAIACAGYRIPAIPGHHKISFEALRLAIGKSIVPYATYYDVCRRKRNIVEYDSSSVITETELQELTNKVLDFQEIVEQWIKHNHPRYSK